MNENINLTKILKDCPKGTKFYSTVYGEVVFNKINKGCEYPIAFLTSCNSNCDVTADGRHYELYYGECTLFPSRDQRDWSKFTAPWYKKEKYEPKTIKPFDKVLVTDINLKLRWKADFFSHETGAIIYPHQCQCTGNIYEYCIPYNDDTKHLVGTKDEAPEFYRYWED